MAAANGSRHPLRRRLATQRLDMAQQTDPEDPLAELRARLRSHPRLFRDHPELLEELELEPGSEATVVALEHARSRRRQRRIQALEKELGDLVTTARENDRLARHLHRLTVELLTCEDSEALIQGLLAGIRDHFPVDQVGIRVAEEGFGEIVDAAYLAPQLWLQRHFVTRDRVVLGPATDWETTGALYGASQSQIASHALLALRRGSQLFGLIGLASWESQRYSTHMGTTYLERLAELAGGLLSQYLREANPSGEP